MRLSSSCIALRNLRSSALSGSSNSSTQRPCQRDTLALSPDELRHAAGLKSLQAHEGQHLGEAGRDLTGRGARHSRAKGNVFVDTAMRKEGWGLKDYIHRPLFRRHVGRVLTVNENPARGRNLQAR